MEFKVRSMKDVKKAEAALRVIEAQRADVLEKKTAAAERFDEVLTVLHEQSLTILESINDYKRSQKAKDATPRKPRAKKQDDAPAAEPFAMEA